ncbi:iron chelate uptake ABC transporter family permease subunit [Plantactinospora sp. DSM 117369]
MLPVVALVGAILVSLAGTLGRTPIAPAQIPAGLVTAMVGAPYFAWLLWRFPRRDAGRTMTHPVRAARGREAGCRRYP